jgi:nitrile hydratase accessory protein
VTGVPDSRATEARVFDEPWEAHAFALTLALHERGVFSWREWSDALAAVLAEARVRGDADTGRAYYRHWLAALERLTARKGLVDDASLAQRRRAWAEAARRTPHGQPIELGAAVGASRAPVRRGPP